MLHPNNTPQKGLQIVHEGMQKPRLGDGYEGVLEKATHTG